MSWPHLPRCGCTSVSDSLDSGTKQHIWKCNGILKILSLSELMPTYRINPYISFIENRLFPGFVQKAVFHRLTGEILEPGERVRSLLFATKSASRISLSEDEVNGLSADAGQIRQLIQKEFLIPEAYDPLTPLLDQYVARPVQN